MIYRLVMAAVLSLCFIPCGLSKSEKIRVPKGSAYSKMEFVSDKHIHLIEVLNRNLKISILAAKSIKLGDQTSRGLFLDDYATYTNAKVIISGGYMSSFSPPTPLGYLRVAGRQFSPKHASWLMAGYFCTDGINHVIEKSDNFGSLDKYRDCIQAGPLFIERGVDRYSSPTALSSGEKRLSEDEQNHAFICLKDSGTIVFGITDEIRLNQLSKWLVKNIKCSSSLRLAGSTSAGMRINGSLLGSDELPLSSVIAISDK